MKVSIITVVLNREEVIEDAIVSVLEQNYPSIEYIIIDGNSTDATLEVINKYSDKICKIISANDGGIYDALNKGIKLATGDLIGFLHSDDFYINNQVISDVVKALETSQADLLFADLLYIDKNNKNKVLRHYTAKGFEPKQLKYGLMPPHPTLFVKKETYAQVGDYQTHYQIAGDFDMFIRLLLTHQASYTYLNQPLIKMRVGGASTGGLGKKIYNNLEQLKCLKANGYNTNHLTLLKKYPQKIKEIILGKLYGLFKN